jgi:hypothetical protein
MVEGWIHLSYIWYIAVFDTLSEPLLMLPHTPTQHNEIKKTKLKINEYINKCVVFI